MDVFTPGLTIEDYETLPLQLVRNHDLIDGELVRLSGNTAGHNAIRDFLIALLYPLVRRGGLGRVIAEQEFAIGENAYAPDVAFVRAAKTQLWNRKLRVQRFAPDLCIEIASPQDRFNSLLQKRDRYLAHGVEEVWLIADESREVYVCRSEGVSVLREGGVLSTPMLPGLELPVSDLFADLVGTGAIG